MKKTVAIIGAGTMGLAAAYHAAKAGHSVTVFESDTQPGGMAAHFDFDGLSLERFYHFVCKADKPLATLLAELGLADKLRWRPTRMGYFYAGRHYPWGDPISLLTFPHLDILSKLRYGLHVFLSTKRNDWSKLDLLHADDWIEANIGERAYDVLWRKLFDLKFFEYAHDVPAAWIWSRIKRTGTSRKSIFQEELGYIHGGSETLIGALVAAIEKLGGIIKLGTPTTRVHIDKNHVTGVTSGGQFYEANEIISTIPVPYVPDLIPDLPQPVLAQYKAQKNIGVVCVLHKLSCKVTDNFWLNINDPRIDIPGIVEFSNLRDMGSDHVVYLPYYMPQKHPKFGQNDAYFVDETLRYLNQINPAITPDKVLASKVGRLRYAQPVYSTGFFDTLPPINPGIGGLQVADTSYYYPEDRGISEGVHLAKKMADELGAAK
jgi:protoporphyrinogen oxidase